MMPKALSSIRVSLAQFRARSNRAARGDKARTASPQGHDKHTPVRHLTPQPQGTLVPQPSAPKSPYDTAMGMLKRHTMQPLLLQQVRAMLLSIPSNEQVAFARQVVVVSAQVLVPRVPVALNMEVLQQICRLPERHRCFVVSEAAVLLQNNDGPTDRAELIRVLARHAKALRALLPSIRSYLLMVPMTSQRAQFMQLLATSPQLDGERAQAVLQLAEPLLRTYDSRTYEMLRWALARSFDAIKNPMAQTSTAASAAPWLPTPTADWAETLSEEQISDILGHDNCYTVMEADYVISRQVDGTAVQIELDAENVMQSRRHVATIAAMGVIKQRAPLPVAVRCIMPIFERMIHRLNHVADFRQDHSLSQEECADLCHVWEGDRSPGDMMQPLRKLQTLTYLREHEMDNLRFLSHVYWAVQSYREPGRSWFDSQKARGLLRTSLFRALAQTYEPKDFDAAPTSADSRKHRVCQVGLVQRVLGALAGYLPYSLDFMQPETLLTTLAQAAFGDDAADELPDFARLLSFVEHAQQRAQDIFGSHSPADLATFNSQLFDYMSITYDFNLAEGTAHLPIAADLG